MRTLFEAVLSLVAGGVSGAIISGLFKGFLETRVAKKVTTIIDAIPDVVLKQAWAAIDKRLIDSGLLDGIEEELLSAISSNDTPMLSPSELQQGAFELFSKFDSAILISKIKGTISE